MGISFGAEISLSGMQAAMKRLHVSADNVARRNVPGSEKNRVINEDRAFGGVDSVVQSIPLTEAQRSSAVEYDQSNIDYAEESLQMTIGKTAMQVNVLAFKNQNDMVGSLLNIKV